MLVNKSKLIKKSSQVYRKFIPNKKSKREREREREKSAAQAQRFPALLLATLCSTSNLAVCNILIGGTTYASIQPSSFSSLRSMRWLHSQLFS